MRKSLHMVTVLSIVILVSTSCSSWQVNRPPKHMMIEQAYFVCDTCGSLQGGIFGKGPTKSFESKTAQKCVHNWHRIPRDEFKRLATERFGIDWTKEIPFWSADSKVLAQ